MVWLTYKLNIACYEEMVTSQGRIGLYKFNIDILAYKGVCTIDIGRFGDGTHCISIVKSDGRHLQVSTTGSSLFKDEVVIREFGMCANGYAGLR